MIRDSGKETESVQSPPPEAQISSSTKGQKWKSVEKGILML